jgi:pimeloyl-ACP methyl ester carboxylesterase
MRVVRAVPLLLALALLGFGPNEGPIRMEPLDASDSPPTFVMLGGPKGPARMVFLHGMCGHGLGYAQSFQWNAAKRGTLVAPQGDRPCGGPWAQWSGDIDALDARIVAAFHALGHEDPIDDVVLMGYSQGATRAEAMARKWPQRYTRLVLIAAPTTASPRGLSSLRAVVMMAGERDRQDLMKAGTRAMLAAGIPSTFMVIPGATHGSMGSAPEKTMGAALDWLWAHQKP